VRILLAVLGVVLIALGVVSLVQPGYAPGRAPPFGQGPSAAPSTPVVSVSGGLYFKTLLKARGTGGVMYLRCYVFDRYEGGAWVYTGGGGGAAFGDGLVTVGGGLFVKGGELNLTGALMGGCVPVASPSVDGFMLGAVRVVAPGVALSADLEGLFVQALRGSPGYVAAYVARGGSAAPDERYLQVPPQLGGRLEELAASLTAGCADASCKAGRIKQFLLANYSYDGTLDAPWPLIPPGADPVLWFLEEGRRGVCIHFASAFVLLARASGVPARLVVGYLSDGPVPAEWSTVAFSPHAWAEYYNGSGWVGVEATPGGGVPAPQLPALPPAVASLPQPPQPETPQLPPLTGASLPGWILPAALAAAGAVAVLASLRRVVTVAVGEEVEFRTPRGFSVYVNRRLVGRAPVRVRFEKAGTYLVRVGPLVYVVRVVDYRRLAGALFLRLLRRLRLPPTVTPRELAALHPKYAEVADLFERVRFGPAASREDFERLRRAL
jgi:transglutaminase-like putative cysteine protease